MIISNPINLDDEMVQCTVEYANGAVVLHVFNTIDDLRDFIALHMKGVTNGKSDADGQSHGILSGYFPHDPRVSSRY